MAADSATRVLRAPGRLVVGPTTEFAAGTFPFGGTEIGKANLCVLMPQGGAYDVEYESLGEIGDVLEGSQKWVFACFLRGWDNDAVQTLLPDGYSAGTVSQHSVFSVPGAQVPGASALGRAVKLAYIPDDPVHVPGVLIYRAVPDWSDGAEIAFRRGSELGIPLAFKCIRDSSNRMLRVGRIVDLAL